MIRMLRHAESESNARGIFAGITDAALSAAGRRQAQAGRISPGVELVYVTPLLRTQQTASILFPRAKQVVVPGLQEINAGVFEGRPYADVEADPAYLAWCDADSPSPCPGGEGRQAFAKRVSQALQTLVNEARSRGESEVYIVGHGWAIMTLMTVHALPKQHFDAWWIANLAGYELRLDNGWQDSLTISDIRGLDYRQA